MARAYYVGNLPEDQKFRGQARLIIDVLKGAATSEQGKTVKELAEAIKADLQTRQDPERVVAFYMAVWKKKGFVKFVELAPGKDAASAGETSPDRIGNVGPFPDLQGKKLSEAVLEVLKWRGQPLTTEGVAALMSRNGFPVRENQVQSAIQNLTKRDAVAKDGEAYVVAQTVAA